MYTLRTHIYISWYFVQLEFIYIFHRKYLKSRWHDIYYVNPIALCCDNVRINHKTAICVAAAPSILQVCGAVREKCTNNNILCDVVKDEDVEEAAPPTGVLGV